MDSRVAVQIQLLEQRKNRTMKKAILFLLLLTFSLMSCVLLHPHIDYPSMPEFPQRYRTWINFAKKNNVTCCFDFHNYETSFLPQVCGFDEDCGGANYEKEVSKYISAHRDVLSEKVPFCARIFLEKYLSKKHLKKSLQTFTLHYGDKTLSLNDFIIVAELFNRFGIIFYEKTSSIDFLGYIDNETFTAFSQSENLLLTFEIDGESFEFNLNIPEIYEDTFSIGENGL